MGGLIFYLNRLNNQMRVLQSLKVLRWGVQFFLTVIIVSPQGKKGYFEVLA